MKRLVRAGVAMATASALMVASPPIDVDASVDLDDSVFISELHYDNEGGDAGEAVEVFAPACTDLDGWAIEFYNGSSTQLNVYDTKSLTGFVPDLDGGFGVLSFDVAGIQNGAPDGLALIDDSGTVRQFLSYEGVFTPTNGTASGVGSTDIGVQEEPPPPVGQSLQLVGSGSTYGDFMWSGPSASNFDELGAIAPAGPGGDPDSCDPVGGGGEIPDVRFSELHYDNGGADTDEAVEVVGPAGTDLSGWEVVFYNGNGGFVDKTVDLSGTIADLGGGQGVAFELVSGIQNGAPDGLALVAPNSTVVEFLSYEGSFTAVGGPADGLISTDIGVSEAGNEPEGLSLQRDAAGDWSGPKCASFGALNDPSAPDECPAASSLVINASLISTAGSADPEYVELFGPAGASLGGLSVIGVESDDQTSNGAIDHRYDLPDDAMIGDNGFYLLGNPFVASTLGVTPNFDFAENGLENSSITLALVETDSITGDSATVDIVVMDSVGVTDGGATDAFAFGAPVVGPDGSFLPAGVRRNVDGVDTDLPADWRLLTFSPANDPNNVPTTGTGDTGGGGGGGDPIEVAIHEVQGATDISPLVDQRVIIEGIVVGDHEGPSPALQGFFVQEEDTDADADDTTSEGVFVFNFTDDSVNVGDLVRVEGTVEERFGNTQLTDFVEVDVLGTNQTLPATADVSFPVASVGDLEAYEGMAATFPQQLVIAEYFNYDQFGEIVVALPADGESRPYNPTALFAPDTPEAAARADLNLRSRITVDDGVTSRYPEAPIHPITRDPLTQRDAFRGGDTVTGLTGPVFFSFSQYRVLPYGAGAGYDTYDRTTPPAEPDDVGGDLTVATLNALNYFLTLDDGVEQCGPTENLDCRGANDIEELARQRIKLLNTLVGMDADVVGLIEVENRPGVEPLADIVDGLNTELGAGTYDFVAAGDDSVVGTDAIKVGMIYRPGAVTPLGDPAILDTPEFLDPNDTGGPKNRAAVAQSFVENDSGEVFSMVVNHLKSKGSGCGAGDDDLLAGSCNLTRTLAAGILTEWIDTDPTGSGDDDWLIVGDLNSYDHEAPIDTLEDAGYTDLIGEYQGELAYSYVFDGQFGYLDYALSSDTLSSQVTGATEWHINADEPDVIDYNIDDRSAAQIALFDDTTPFRSSDHDAALVGLSLSSFDAKVLTFPRVLRYPNHGLRPVVVIAVGGRGLVDSTIVDVSSSEADSGLGRGDRPDDIQILRDWLVLLRAEEFSDGRTYELTVQMVDGGQVRIETSQVVVPDGGSWWW